MSEDHPRLSSIWFVYFPSLDFLLDDSFFSYNRQIILLLFEYGLAYTQRNASQDLYHKEQVVFGGSDATKLPVSASRPMQIGHVSWETEPPACSGTDTRHPNPSHQQPTLTHPQARL